jgi:hypothetical protein
VIPQAKFITGTAIVLDPAGTLCAAIRVGNLRAYVQGQDDVGIAGWRTERLGDPLATGSLGCSLSTGER